MSLYWLFLFCSLSYLLGNLNISVIVSNKRKKDIRAQGSGNPGTMNMVRTFGFKVGLLVLTVDVVKGAIPALVGYLAFGGAANSPSSIIALYACGLSVVIGHCFPAFFGFKGGKGVATTVGVFLVANPVVCTICFLIMNLYLIIFEYGAMASFLFMTFMVSYQALHNSTNIAICCLLFVFYFLIWFTHRTNIFRLLTGKENSVTYLKSIQKKKLKKKHEQWLASLKEIK